MCSSAQVVVRAAAMAALLLVALVSAAAARADGSFRASDDELTRIWQASVTTATDTISPPENLDPRDCNISLPEVILDSPKRDRCPYIGDIAVTGMTLLVTQNDVDTLRSMIEWFANVQNRDGSIPDGAIFNHTDELIDYNAYWVEALYDYTLYSGDLTLLQELMPHVVLLMNTLYPKYVEPDGLLADWLRGEDYAYVFRAGPEVAYYDAQYIRALGLAAALATWDGDAADAAAWLGRQAAARAAFAPAFWDATAGAFSDTNADRAVHALDGNVFAILAGAATPQQAASALAYIGRTMSHPQGDAVVDTPNWGPWEDDATQHIYPFIGYFELLAMYAAGDDAGALDLIRREWGTMLDAGPGTMWETIDASTGQPSFAASDVDHGWSSGAAPALTSYVLGVLPTSPGFATFTVIPHPADLPAAGGDVPTPHGDIQVYWQVDGSTPEISVTAPAGTVWSNAPGGAAAPVNTAVPAISGPVVPGTVLTATAGTWSGTAPVAIAYQWATCPSSGLGCVPVAGATSSTYTVQPGDDSGTIRVFVIGSNGSGSSSATVLAVPPPPPPPDTSGGGGGGGGSAPAAPAAAPAPPAAPTPPAAPPPAPVTPAPLLPARGISSTAGFRLVVKVTGAGRVRPRSGVYRRGLKIRLAASPSRGWHFAGWGGRWCTGSRPACTITMTQGKVVRALFARNRRG